MYADLRETGFERSAAALDGKMLLELEALFDQAPADRPGLRVDAATIKAMAAHNLLASLATEWLAADARCVRAILFDKSDGVNWSLAWHQDRTIEVAAHVDVPGFGPFTRKQGRLHVAPPIDVIERMVTMRVHLDPVDRENGPLIVAPGSHRLGYVAESRIADTVASCGKPPALLTLATFGCTPRLSYTGRTGRFQAVEGVCSNSISAPTCCLAVWPGWPICKRTLESGAELT